MIDGGEMAEAARQVFTFDHRFCRHGGKSQSLITSIPMVLDLQY
jgi:hypothetical protein